MSWHIELSRQAKQDIRDIYEYISFVFSAPETAKKQIRRILQKVDSLNEMPMRYRLYYEEPWHSKGLRFLPVDNYLIFYIPDSESFTVNIVRIIYGRRNIEEQLNRLIGF